jgi:hypothetical protein
MLKIAFLVDVDIKPETKEPINRKLFELWKKMNGSREAQIAVFDGKRNIYTPKKLNLVNETGGDEIELSLVNDEREKYIQYFKKF